MDDDNGEEDDHDDYDDNDDNKINIIMKEIISVFHNLNSA